MCFLSYILSDKFIIRLTSYNVQWSHYSLCNTPYHFPFFFLFYSCKFNFFGVQSIRVCSAYKNWFDDENLLHTTWLLQIYIYIYIRYNYIDPMEVFFFSLLFKSIFFVQFYAFRIHFVFKSYIRVLVNR